jgi:hypothetical protein
MDAVAATVAAETVTPTLTVTAGMSAAPSTRAGVTVASPEVSASVVAEMTSDHSDSSRTVGTPIDAVAWTVVGVTVAPPASRVVPVQDRVASPHVVDDDPHAPAGAGTITVGAGTDATTATTDGSTVALRTTPETVSVGVCV